MRAFFAGALVLLSFARLGHGGDLTKIDRMIRKEPAYHGKPRYALLVLGPKAETRMWLVIDGKTLYIDRNANGDLTEVGERVAAVKSGSDGHLEFRAGAFVEADGTTKHSDLVVYQYLAPQFGHLVNTVSVMDVLGTLGQTSNGEEGCSFGDTPRSAPVIHMNGPLTLRAHSVCVDSVRERRLKPVPFELGAGEHVSELHVQVGTPGIGKGSFAALSVEKGFPANIHPLVEVRMPSKADAKRTIQARFWLKDRC